MRNLTIVKVGGKILEDESTLQCFINRFAALQGPKMLVHGGGRTATALARSLGVPTRMVEGRRITDADMLRIVVMAYGGLVNKRVVARLQALGVDALGLTGADMDVVRSHRRPITPEGIDYGYVGDVEAVRAPRIAALLQQGITPVLAPLTHDGKGTLLNTNADTMAGAVARAMAGSGLDVTLVYCFEHAGVLSDSACPDSVIPRITPTIFAQLKADGTVTGGMLPKLQNCMEAVQAGVSRVVITGAGSIGAGGTVVEPD